MMSTGTGTQSQAVIWADSARVDVVSAVLGRLPQISVAAVAGPRKGDLADLAASFSADMEDDFRQLLLNRPGVQLLLATQQGIKRDDIRMALEMGVDVLTLEPAVSQADQVIGLDASTSQNVPGRLMLMPLWRYSPGYLAALEPQEALGRIHTIAVSSIRPPGCGSLFAQLVDGLDMVIDLLGVPVTISASLTGPLTTPPEDLRGLTGAMSLNLNFAQNAAVTIQVSDQAALFRRTMTVVATDGTLLLGDHDYRLFTTSGQPLDESSESQTAEKRELNADLTELIAHQWRYILTRKPLRNGLDARAIVGCCETALLAARTGQVESTETLVRIKM